MAFSMLKQEFFILFLMLLAFLYLGCTHSAEYCCRWSSTSMEWQTVSWLQSAKPKPTCVDRHTADLKCSSFFLSSSRHQSCFMLMFALLPAFPQWSVQLVWNHFSLPCFSKIGHEMPFSVVSSLGSVSPHCMYVFLYCNAHSALIFSVCVSAHSPPEEGDPGSEGRAGHADRRAEGRAAHRGGDPQVCRNQSHSTVSSD